MENQIQYENSIAVYKKNKLKKLRNTIYIQILGI